MRSYARFFIEFQLSAVDMLFTWEVRTHGKPDYLTKWRRHYLLKRLLDIQLKEFDR